MIENSLRIDSVRELTLKMTESSPRIDSDREFTLRVTENSPRIDSDSKLTLKEIENSNQFSLYFLQSCIIRSRVIDRKISSHCSEDIMKLTVKTHDIAKHVA